ncbi:MAG TPA: hypothetical protein DF383_00095 [Deltaproteobacteria bacterium]|nr:hypothetical protein [Deltaproteobacteria bacterium]
MKPVFLSVDLGGTSLRIAALDAEANFLAQRSLSSDRVRQGSEFLRVLLEEIQQVSAETARLGPMAIQGLALGVPGLVDRKKGQIRQSPHFPKWRDLEVTAPLRAVLPFPIYLENDANQAALGEAWKGAGKNWPDFILVTLGTGVGGGIIQEGKIYHGPNGYAGEIGHIVIDRHGLPGALGSRGTLETLASQSGLRLQLASLHASPAALCSEAIRQLDPDSRELPLDLALLADGGDVRALEIWEDFGAALACGIASLANAFGFDRFVIGGGLEAAWHHFAAACQNEIRNRMYPLTSAALELRRAELKNEAGLIGGVRVVQLG